MKFILPLAIVSLLLSGSEQAWAFGGKPKRPPAVSTPSIPSSFSASSSSPDRINLSWTQSGTYTGLELEKARNAQFTDSRTLHPLGRVNTTALTGLDANTTYYFRLRAVNSGRVSAYTSTINVTTQAIPVVVPPNPIPPPNPPPSSTVSAILDATRLSGPAPLAVQFDATRSTGNGITLPFHQLTYSFNFGDERGQNWSISNRPKNTQSGAALAAHVFDNPGLYYVTVQVTNPATGQSSQASVAITVTDPNADFAGNNTICVSNANNFTGCPAGALQQNALPRDYAGKRVLLRRGERFSSVNLNGTDDNVIVAAYGTGAKPIVDLVFLGGNNRVAAWPDGVVIMDLNITNGFGILVTASRVLLYRCDMVDPDREKIDVGTALHYNIENGSLPASAYYWPREIFLVENNAIGDTDNDNVPHIVTMGFFTKSALLGNTFNRATEHTVRIWAGFKVVLAHNDIGGEHYTSSPPGIRAALKFHSSGILPFHENVGTSGSQIASRYLVTADNRFGSPQYPGSWTVGFGPQNADPGTVEGLEDIIMERDLFRRGPYTSQDIHNVARRVTVRSQTVENGRPLLMHQLAPNEFSGDIRMQPWIGPYFGMPNNY